MPTAGAPGDGVVTRSVTVVVFAKRGQDSERKHTMRFVRRSIVLFRLGSALLLVAISVRATQGAEPRVTSAQINRINAHVNAQYDSLLALYHHFHRHPELSLHEERTAAKLADELRAVGYTVTTGVGGHGVVALMKNGPGPTVMVRTDLDALPVRETTGLPYASAVTTTDPGGRTVHVMHACGHDVHITSLIGVARVLAALREEWAGTLMLIGQPAEERGLGAAQMLDDGLFRRFPKPDFALALHVDATLEAGRVGYCPGYALANVDSVDITVHGRGGHGSTPHATIDPIVIAARIVVALQTIVSREVKPIDDAVVTVGSIHGGTKHNIIPDEVRMQLTVRSYTDAVRSQVLAAIRRVALGVAASAGAADPTVTTSEGTPATYNDPALTARCASVFERVLGQGHVVQLEPVMGGEDFSLYGRAGVPALIYRLGSVDPARMAESRRPGGKPLPSLHSARYAPIPDPTIKVGVRTMCAAVLDLLAK